MPQIVIFKTIYNPIYYKGDKEIGTIPEEIRMKISDDLV